MDIQLQNLLKNEIKILLNGDSNQKIEGCKQFLNNNGTNFGYKDFFLTKDLSYKNFLDDKKNYYEKYSDKEVSKKMIDLLKKLNNYNYINKKFLEELKEFYSIS